MVKVWFLRSIFVEYLGDIAFLNFLIAPHEFAIARFAAHVLIIENQLV